MAGTLTATPLRATDDVITEILFTVIFDVGDSVKTEPETFQY
jgi:hypothetical protein